MTDQPSATQDTIESIELLWHIMEGLVSTHLLVEILQLIVNATAEVMRTNICSVMLLNEDGQTLRIAATQALSRSYTEKSPVKMGESVSGRVVKEGMPALIPDLSKEKSYGFPDVAREEGLVSMACIPMRYKGRCIGVINCYTKTIRHFSDLEVKVLQAVANQAALAIETSRLEER